MKILVSCEDFYPSMGGAESWLTEVMEALGEDNQVDIHYVGEQYPRARNYKCHPRSPLSALKFPILKRTLIRHYLANKKWKSYLRKQIKKDKPDLIITQLMYTPATVDIAKEFDIPIIVFLHTYEHFCACYYKEHHPKDQIHIGHQCYSTTTKLQEPWVSWLRSWHAMALHKADAIVANSKYMADTLKHVHKLNSKVIFPLIDDEKYKSNNSSRIYTLFINPIKAKGAEIFIETANLLPDEKFLVVGGVYDEYIEQVKQLPNVTYLPSTNNMKDVYSKSRVLIAPSQWYEPFGRVALEACIAEVPPIVSDRGGLPEAAGKGAVVIKDVDNPQAWATAIKEFRKPKFYLERRKAAKEHAKLHTKEKQMEKIYKIISKVLRK